MDMNPYIICPTNPYEVPTGPTSGVMKSGIVARVGPQLPSFRFDVNDLVWGT